MMAHQTHLTGRALGYRAVQVLGYVNDCLASEGMAPSYGMIAEELGIATKGEVCRIVTALERRALLSRAGCGRVRRIRLPSNC
jgi:SOS-response transcriptional repressor LexA